jgi:hypothetical protein
MNMATNTIATNGAVDLPVDNATRLAIFDTLHESRGEDGLPKPLTEKELLDAIIARLRVLVPRELHLAGEPQAYLHDKLNACAEANLISIRSLDGESIIAPTGIAPLVRYPDGEIREYTPGLEMARERLDGDNARLRDSGFYVRRFIPSSADDPDSPEFQALLASMREHGFLKQFSIVAQDDDVVIDGRARIRAATRLELKVEYLKYPSKREQAAARRRDTPLNRVMIAVQANFARLSCDTVSAVHDAVAAVTRRPWDETAADLALTAVWRRSMPPEYSPQFEVSRLAFRPGAEAKIQVTADDKVMLRSLIEAAGLSNYKTDMLKDYVPIEEARSNYSGGRKALFARAEDLITGIATMQRERRTLKRKLDPEWDTVRDWLIATFQNREGSEAA